MALATLKKLHLPRETFLPFFEVSLQHGLQLFLQDTEGLPGGQAQGQGGLSLQGSQRCSASLQAPGPCPHQLSMPGWIYCFSLPLFLLTPVPFLYQLLPLSQITTKKKKSFRWY
jgi:hypothetical protein